MVLAGVMDVPYLLQPGVNLLSFVFSAAIGVVFGYFPGAPRGAHGPDRGAAARVSMVIWECELLDPIRVMIKTIVFLES
jgi:hypothetical protein